MTECDSHGWKLPPWYHTSLGDNINNHNNKIKGNYHFTTKVILTYHVSTMICRKVHFTIKHLCHYQFTTIPLRKH